MAMSRGPQLRVHSLETDGLWGNFNIDLEMEGICKHYLDYKLGKYPK